MRGLVVLVVVLASCAGPSAWGLRTFDVDDDAVAVGAAAAVARWPEVAPIVDRLDVFGIPRGDLRFECRRPDLRVVEGCALRPGSALSRARIYVAADANDVAAIVEHELQHLRPSVWALPDACGDHRPACWEAP